MKSGETPAQFTERLREKYKDILAQMEEHYTDEQRKLDKLIGDLFILPKRYSNLEEFNQQLKKYLKKLL